MKNLRETDVLIAIITITLLFFLFAVFTVIYFLLASNNKKKLQGQLEQSRRAFEQQLLQVQVEVQESTYRHVARELHDNVGQLLGTTKMLMGISEIKLGEVPEALRSANGTLSKAIQEIRLLSRSLDKEWLAQFNFVDNLHQEVERLRSGGTIDARVQCTEDLTMNTEQQLVLFRMVQEAIQNAVRHAQPSYIDVSVQQHKTQLEVRIVNDGMPLPPHFQGMGTNNMRHRARLFGGTVHWFGKPESTSVVISIPLMQSL